MTRGWDSKSVLELVARAILSLTFAYLGAMKAADPIGFLKLVRQFEMIQSPMALNFVAAVLPWFEVFCGLLLLAGIGRRGTALLMLAMLLSFTTAVALRAFEIHRAGGQAFCAIRFDCGCGAGNILICAKLVENTALAFLAVAVLMTRSQRYCLWPDLKR
jgi:uncharacterized membrane protein YphA (DoxX/SURF4 family)